MALKSVTTMPKYRCHQEVWALEIATVERATARGGTLYPKDRPSEKIIVSKEFMDAYQPQAGGYYVVYPDLSDAFLSAAAFAQDYTKIDAPPRLPDDRPLFGN